MGTIERKEREKELRRKLILEAGQKLFLEKGMQNTTMDDIANICELSKGTLYLYFKNKEELFLTMSSKALGIYIDMLKENLKDPYPPDKKMQIIGETYLNFYKKYPNNFKILNYNETHENNQITLDETSVNLILKMGEIWKIVTDTIDEGISKGIYKKNINSFEIAVTLWAASTGIIELMDHINTSHKCLKMENIPEDIDRAFNLMNKLNYEKLLYQTWDMLISSIRTVKNNIDEAVPKRRKIVIPAKVRVHHVK